MPRAARKRVFPSRVSGKAVFHGVGHSGDCLRCRRQSLQIAQRLVIQLAQWIDDLVASRYAAGPAELIEVVDNAAAAFDGTVGVGPEDAGRFIPFEPGVDCLRFAFDVEAFGSDEFHRRTQNATVAPVAVVHEITECRHAQAVAVSLQIADRLEVAGRIARAVARTRIRKFSRFRRLADPDAGVEEGVARERSRSVRMQGASEIGAVTAFSAFARLHAAAVAAGSECHAVEAVRDDEIAGPVPAQPGRHGVGNVGCGQRLLGEIAVGDVVEHGALQDGERGCVDDAVAAGQSQPKHIDRRARSPVQEVAAETRAAAASPVSSGGAIEAAKGGVCIVHIGVAALGIEIADVGILRCVDRVEVLGAYGREFDGEGQGQRRLLCCAARQRLGRKCHQSGRRRLRENHPRECRSRGKKQGAGDATPG